MFDLSPTFLTILVMVVNVLMYVISLIVLGTKKSMHINILDKTQKKHEERINNLEKSHGDMEIHLAKKLTQLSTSMTTIIDELNRIRTFLDKDKMK